MMELGREKPSAEAVVGTKKIAHRREENRRCEPETKAMRKLCYSANISEGPLELARSGIILCLANLTVKTRTYCDKVFVSRFAIRRHRDAKKEAVRLEG